MLCLYPILSNLPLYYNTLNMYLTNLMQCHCIIWWPLEAVLLALTDHTRGHLCPRIGYIVALMQATGRLGRF